ncbi:MAG TPA: FxSxx-COOH system tetratricopeptide repeat protein [Trebonia sp.]|nr:FxSxx-COOH system tetratricopeptide repeat protein [Trebonia sp.]
MAGHEDGIPETRRDMPSRDLYHAEHDLFHAEHDLYHAGRDLHIHPAPAPAPPAPIRAWGNVPARNPAFAGREEPLAAVHDALTSGNRAAVQALHGIGGVGKTQLAIEYAHRHAEDYDVVWWLDSENTTLLAQQFAELAGKLDCAPAGAQPDEIRSAVLSDLHDRPRWLLVFDNAEQPDELRPWLPAGPGHVLITSRSSAWAELAIPVPVDVLPRAEAIALLRSRVPSLPEPDADTLADALGDLPIALAQAAAYLTEAGISAADYVGLLRGRAHDLLGEGKPSSYGTTLTAVTTLAWDQLCGTDADAACVAGICAQLAPEPIAVEWLTTAAGDLPGGLAGRLADPLARGRLLKALTSTSLARLSDDGLTMHRLTQAILRTSIPAADAAAALAQAERVITASNPGDNDRPATWPAWARLLPHIIALNPAATTDDGLRETAADAAWYLLRGGHHAQARDLAARLRDGWTDRPGPDHPQTLRIATTLAVALRRLGQGDQARQLNEDTLDRSRRVLGDDHPETLGVATNLAVTLRTAGEHQAARQLDEDTLQRKRRTLGDNDPSTLRTANNLALNLRLVGDHEGARRLNQDTLQRKRAVLGDDHPSTLSTANNLALNLRQLGDYQAARQLDLDTLQRKRRALGDTHPDTLRSASNLAADLRGLGDYEAALELDQDTLEQRRRTLGEEHGTTQESKRNLAEDLRLLGQAPAPERPEPPPES